MEILKLVITILFVIAALAIIVVVLLQEGKSAGLGSLSGATGNNDSYWEKNKKNSLEGKFERWTKITAGMFVVFALVLMLLNSNGTVAKVEAPASDAATESTTTTDGTTTEATEGAETTPEATTDGTAEATDQAADETNANNAEATDGAQAQDAANANSTN